MARFSKQKQFVTIYLKCALLVPENVCFYMLCLLAISNLIHQYLISITYHRRQYFFIKQSHALELGLPTDTPQKQNHTRAHITLPPSLLKDKTHKVPGFGSHMGRKPLVLRQDRVALLSSDLQGRVLLSSSRGCRSSSGPPRLPGPAPLRLRAGPLHLLLPRRGLHPGGRRVSIITADLLPRLHLRQLRPGPLSCPRGPLAPRDALVAGLRWRRLPAGPALRDTAVAAAGAAQPGGGHHGLDRRLGRQRGQCSPHCRSQVRAGSQLCI